MAVLLLPACSGNDGPVPAEGDAKTPEAVAATIRPALAPLAALLDGPAAYNGNFAYVDPGVCGKIKAAVGEARAAHAGSENGKAALARIADELEDLIRRARDDDRWGVVLCAIDVHEELRPGMHLMRLLRKRAMLHAMRPHVVIKGFFDDNDRNELYVFLQVTLRRGYRPWPAEAQTDDGAGAGEGESQDVELAAPAPLVRDETHMVQVRVKEEFYGLRLAGVVGKKRGVELEYLADPGHFFRVMMRGKTSGTRGT